MKWLYGMFKGSVLSPWSFALRTVSTVAHVPKLLFCIEFRLSELVSLCLFFFSSGNCGLCRSLCKYAEEHLWLQCIKGTAFREKPPQDSHRCNAWRYGFCWSVGFCLLLPREGFSSLFCYWCLGAISPVVLLDCCESDMQFVFLSFYYLSVLEA